MIARLALPVLCAASLAGGIAALFSLPANAPVVVAGIICMLCGASFALIVRAI